MAAIDKLYITEYDDLANLRIWANAYYPKLFFWFYERALTIDEEEFNKLKKKYAKKRLLEATSYWRQISPDNTINGAVAHLMGQGWPEEDAKDEAEYYYDWAHRTVEEFEKLVGITVMNTPSRVDRLLKWYCPLDRIREYLKDQCGVKTRWYHKLFWKGKERFTL